MAPKYEDGKIGDDFVLLPMTIEEAKKVKSLLMWAIGDYQQSDASIEALCHVNTRLRGLLPKPGPIVIKW